jgi:hypothetical protein
MEAENESLAPAAWLALVIASRASGGQGAGTGPFLTWNAGEFDGKWEEVIHEWSARYGKDVAGWWFDGGYRHVHFSGAIAPIYADAVKSGNPDAIVAFNPGVMLGAGWRPRTTRPARSTSR